MHLLQYFDKLSLNPENAKELKGLILDLAIRGQLTEEWRNENLDVEHASVLLDKIEEQKTRLIKEKKIRKNKELPELLVDEAPFKLPQTWEWTRIGNIGEVFNGNSISKSVKESKYNHIEEGYVYLGTKDISYGFDEFNYDTGVVIPFDEAKFKIAKKDTVLICSEGGSAGKKCGITNENICFGNKLYAIEPFIRIEPVYILSLYLSKSFQYAFQERMTGIIGGISKNNFKEIPFPIPPIAEQKAIVKIVNQLMEEVDQLEAETKTRVQLRHDFIKSSLRQLTTANSSSEWKKLQLQFTSFFDTAESIDKLKEAILQLAVQGKLTKQWRQDNPNVESASVLLDKIKEEKARLIKEKKIKKEKPLPEIGKEEIPFELPEGWVITNFGDLIILKSGQDLKPTQYSNTDQSGLPYITGASNLKNDKVIINRWTNEPKSIAFQGDLLLTCKGSGVGKMGWLHVEKAHIARQIMAINTLGSSLKFVRIFLNTKLNFFKENANGLIPGLDRKMIRTLITYFPPLAEQKEIVKIINQLMDYCDQMKSAIDNKNTLSKDFLRSSIREVMEKTQSLA